MLPKIHVHLSIVVKVDFWYSWTLFRYYIYMYCSFYTLKILRFYLFIRLWLRFYKMYQAVNFLLNNQSICYPYSCMHKYKQKNPRFLTLMTKASKYMGWLSNHVGKNLIQCFWRLISVQYIKKLCKVGMVFG